MKQNNSQLWTTNRTSQQAYAEWFAEIPEQQFRALLEWLYHALQVKELQAEAFERWQLDGASSVEVATQAGRATLRTGAAAGRGRGAVSA